METTKLKKFAQFARRSLIEQISAKLKHVLSEDSAARRERMEAVRKLEEAIHLQGNGQVIERVAYIWFNRFCALRFMDVNRYTRIGVVSPAEGQFQPEILAEAKMGHIDEEMVPDKARQQIFSLLDGKAPSRDPQGEAYRLLMVAACNYWNGAMPFLFQRIEDYTELLMPDDLLSGNSILAYTREAMMPEACKDVEVIGWLYQFYISEKKDEVFDGLKKNKKITPENIPAATQLFTPHWIVRYLVENSLGRLWLLNRPGSKLIEQMDYYIKPEQAEADFLRINKPEEIKICDPACGSGHMLTYAFDLLHAIYEEEGVDPAEIPEKILTHNLYGIEIDERAGELAAFALTMKARAKQRRFFNKGVKPNICVLENVRFDDGELKEYMDFVGRNLFTAPLQITLRQFEEADNFGSLIRPDVADVDGMLRILESKNVSGHLFLSMTHQKVLQALRQADYLRPKYHVVIANPPYAGGRGLNGRLTGWLKVNYKNSHHDLMTCFMNRSSLLTKSLGYWAMINLPSWMFLSTFEKMRVEILREQSIASLLQMGRGVFGSDFGSVAFVFFNSKPTISHKGVFKRLFTRSGDVQKVEEIEANFFSTDYPLHSVTQEMFLKIPGSPIAFWVKEPLQAAFAKNPRISDVSKPMLGMRTGNNERFLRFWQEVSFSKIGLAVESADIAQQSSKKWFPYNKGGEFRKWFGNNELIVNWENDGYEIKAATLESYPQLSWDNLGWKISNEKYFFKPGITWTTTSASYFGVRYTAAGAIFDVQGSSMFPKTSDLEVVLGTLGSKPANEVLKILNPTIVFQPRDIGNIPFVLESMNIEGRAMVQSNVSTLISVACCDWNGSETSWDFTCLPLLNAEYRQPTLKATYQKLRAHWREMALEMQRLEEENNRIFIEAYGLQDEMTPEVPINEITLTCNPHYRYGNDKSEDDLEALLLTDTMRDLVSYAVGCMFGRYALDKQGLILANQGETIKDYYEKLSANDTKGTKEDQDRSFSDFREFRGQALFPADGDNVIPMLDSDWFPDDIAERLRKFLRVAFGEEHYEENLDFVQKALGKNGKARDIRDYFLKDFYTDHWKRYKKRPIYWLFSSSQGSFNALIYMHRYQPYTASAVLEYLRDFKDEKLPARKRYLEAVSINASTSQSDKTKAIKEIEKINKIISELEDYERDILYPLATEQKEIDLDDGVKVNYGKFGSALKKIPGLDSQED